MRSSPVEGGRNEVDALHLCPLVSVASCLINADVRLHIPMTRRNGRYCRYLDQTERARERENTIAMHRCFQRDMFRIRLTAVRNYVNALETSLAPMVASVNVSLRATATVQVISMTLARAERAPTVARARQVARRTFQAIPTSPQHRSPNPV